MKKLLAILILFVVFFASCTVGQVSTLKENGYFAFTNIAKTIKQEPAFLDSLKTTIIIPNEEFARGMVKNIGYFDEIITFEEFEMQIIEANKQDEVGALAGKIGLNNAFKKFKPFVYLKYDRNKKKKNFLQMKLINPGTFKDLMVAEIFMDYAVGGVYDRNTFNPLFNELIKYIENNSETYKKAVTK